MEVIPVPRVKIIKGNSTKRRGKKGNKKKSPVTTIYRLQSEQSKCLCHGVLQMANQRCSISIRVCRRSRSGTLEPADLILLVM